MCPAFAKTEPCISVVTIRGGETDYGPLRDMFRHASWELFEATNATEALDLIKTRRISVVLTDRRLPEGSWKDVLSGLRKLKPMPTLIVTAKCADEYLWAEVLNMGGYDVLVQPFDQEEVRRVIPAANRHFKNESERSRKGERRQRQPLVLSAAG